MSREYTWQQRWALGGARSREDWRRYLRNTVPDYAKVDDRYEALQALYTKNKISADTLAIKGGKCIEKMDELSKPHLPEPPILGKGPPT